MRLLLRPKDGDEVAGRVGCYTRHHNNGTLERWIVIRNPGYARQRVQAYESSQQPGWHTPIQDQTLIDGHGWKWQRLSLQVIQVLFDDLHGKNVYLLVFAKLR